MATAEPTTTVTTPDGRSLDVYLAGPPDGDVLLFHFGTPSGPLPYQPSVDLMAERGLRYVAFSRAGYGSSTRRPGRSVADVVDDARVVLDHVGAERAVTIGWSGGGPHALACAALLPDRIRSVATLASVAPYPADGLDYLAGMGDENIEEFNAALEGPEALIAFKERNWPIFREVTADQVAGAFGDLIDDVDRGVADRRLRRLAGGQLPGGAARVLLGLVRRRHGHDPAVGLRPRVDRRARPRLAGTPRPDGAVRPRRMARRAHPDRDPALV